MTSDVGRSALADAWAHPISPSIDFYEAAGAEPMDEWTVFRLTDDALTAFAEPRSDR